MPHRDNVIFRQACRRAGLSDVEIDDFSEFYHEQLKPSAGGQDWSFRDLAAAALEWKGSSGGRFRRAHLRRKGRQGGGDA